MRANRHDSKHRSCRCDLCDIFRLMPCARAIRSACWTMERPAMARGWILSRSSAPSTRLAMPAADGHAFGGQISQRHDPAQKPCHARHRRWGDDLGSQNRKTIRWSTTLGRRAKIMSPLIYADDATTSPSPAEARLTVRAKRGGGPSLRRRLFRSRYTLPTAQRPPPRRHHWQPQLIRPNALQRCRHRACQSDNHHLEYPSAALREPPCRRRNDHRRRAFTEHGRHQP